MRRVNTVRSAILLSAMTVGTAGAQQTPTSPVAFTPQQTSGMIGIVSGQTARLNALNPGVPAPLATGARCPAQLSLVDDQGKVLGSAQVTIDPGKSASLDFAMTGSTRLEIRAVISFTQPTPLASGGSMTIVAPLMCNLVPTLEIVDSDQKTASVLTDFRLIAYPMFAPGMMGGGSMQPR